MAKRAAVHIERRHGIAFLIIDNPPVNALSLDLHRALIESMSALSFDAAMKAIVLVGGNGTFVSDLTCGSSTGRQPSRPCPT